MARSAVPVLAGYLPGVLAVQPAFRLPNAIKATISHWKPKVLLIAFFLLSKQGMPSTQPGVSNPLEIDPYPDLAGWLSRRHQPHRDRHLHRHFPSFSNAANALASGLSRQKSINRSVRSDRVSMSYVVVSIFPSR